MNNEKRLELELSIVRRIAQDALKAGYFVSVDDGEGYPVLRSRDLQQIMAAVASVDEERLLFHAAGGKGSKAFGAVHLVYGNEPWEVICDHTASERMDKLLSGAVALANKIEETHG
jgi:hypothetical protein